MDTGKISETKWWNSACCKLNQKNQSSTEPFFSTLRVFVFIFVSHLSSLNSRWSSSFVLALFLSVIVYSFIRAEPVGIVMSCNPWSWCSINCTCLLAIWTDALWCSHVLGNRTSADQPCLLNHILISEKSVGVLHSLEFFYYFVFISYWTSIRVIGRMVFWILWKYCL